ncbi:MAG: Gldg family protein [Gemmatimonadales bacterium]
MNRVWTIARREWRSLFDHPTGYILLIVFVAVNNFLFFRQAYLLGAASLRPMMDLLPWMFLFLVPAVTMRALADDARTGTIEVVLAQPVTELEFLLGKYLGVLLFLWSALAATLVIPLGLSFGADLHTGVIVAQYVGAALLAAGLAGVGMWTSSLTRNQVTAFIVGVAVMFVLILVGLDPLLVGLPPALSLFAARLGVLSHFSDIGRGVISLRDVLYFVSLSAVFLALAYGALLGRKLSAGGAARRRLRLGVLTIAAAGIVVSLLGGVIGGRLDLTPGRAYTLSPATRAIVRDAGDLITIRLFASKELPPEISLLKRDLDDLLRDVRNAGQGNVRLVERDPAESPEAAEEAQRLGVPPIQFNVVGESQLQIREGYLGLVVQFADRTEAIPLIRQTVDLEYRLASIVRNLTRTSRPAVGIYVATPQDVLGPIAFQQVQRALGEQYEVRMLDLATDTVPADLRVLVIAGNPDSVAAETTTKVREHLAGGGGLLLMAHGTQAQPMQQSLLSMPKPVVWNDLLVDYGVTIHEDVVYDLRSHESVSVPGQFGRVFTQYPFWVRALSTGRSVVNQELQNTFLPWPSSIGYADSATVTPLLVTSPAAGHHDGFTTLDPQRQFSSDSLETRVLAVQVNPLAGDDATQRGRLVVVGNTPFAADRHVNNATANGVFVLNAVDWLAQDDALIRIRSKDRQPPALIMSAGAREAVKLANIVGVPLLIALAGLLRLVRRRRMTRRTWDGGVA